MSDKNGKYGGFLAVEVAVALTILGMLIVGLALSLDGFAKLNRYQLVRQRCVAAAQAELDSLAATGEPISERDFERLWPKLAVAIEESEGIGQWKGMKLVKVTASGKSFGNEVKVQLARYILTEEGR